MKLLPCTERCHGRPALQSKKRARVEVLHALGTLSSPVYRYVCERCGHLCRITSAAFAALPRLDVDQLLALGIVTTDDLAALSDPANLHLVGDLDRHRR